MGPMDQAAIDRAVRVLGVANEMLAAHEVERHAGSPCWAERLNLMAWMIHRLGLGDLASRVMLQMRVMEYEVQHDHEDAMRVKN